MRKCVPTVIYKCHTLTDKQIFTFVVNRGNNLIDFTATVKDKKFKSFQELYETVLKTLKENNFYVDKEKAFGGYIYNVQFIDIDEPTKIDKILFRKEN